MAIFGRKKNSLKEKFNLKEAIEAEKRGKRMSKQANPLRAMQEAEPFAQAQAKPVAISQLKHKDQSGNEIVDPDRSNPTRHRMERPLDTIRSFERAIYMEGREMRRIRRNDSADGKRRSHQAPVSQSNTEQPNPFLRNESFDDAGDYRETHTYQSSPNSRSRHNINGQHVSEHSRRPTADTSTNSYFSRDMNASSVEHYSTNPSSESSSYGRRESENYSTAPQKPYPYTQPSYYQNENQGLQGQQLNHSYGDEAISPISPTYNYYSTNGQSQQQSGSQGYPAQQQQHVNASQYNNNQQSQNNQKRPSVQQQAYSSYAAHDNSTVPRVMQYPISQPQAPPPEKRRSWFRRGSKSLKV